MPRRFLPWTIALSAVLACSCVLLAQNGANPAKTQSTAPKSGYQVPKTAWGEPDFSGMWEPKMPPSAREFAGYSFISHKDAAALMTPWGKERYMSTKPAWGPLATPDSTDMVNPTTGNEGGSFPTCMPRIWVHPFPTKIVQIPGTVYFLHEFNHFVREIYTNEGREHPKDEDPWWM